MNSDQRDAWDRFAAEQDSFALLQSWPWGEFKEKLDWIVYRLAVMAEDRILASAQLLIKPLPGKFASIAYIPRGPLGAWHSDSVAAILFLEFHRLARRHRAIFLKIEPPFKNDRGVDRFLQQHGFSPSPYTNQPRATIVLDLTPSLDEILYRLRKKHRAYIRDAMEKGITVRPAAEDDLPEIYKLIASTARREHFPMRRFEYYLQEWHTLGARDQAVFLMAFYQGQLLGVRTIYRFGPHAAEFQAGSAEAEHGLHPNHLLVWEGIQWAKQHGCATYDFWGIPDEAGQAVFDGQPAPVSEQKNGLWGVYRFKTGFSKNIIFYLGAYDYVYHPFLYRLITNPWINSNTLEGVSAWLDTFSGQIQSPKPRGDIE